MMPTKKYRYLSFLVSPELEEELKAVAAKQERSVSWIVKKAIAEYIGLNAPAAARRQRKPGSR